MRDITLVRKTARGESQIDACVVVEANHAVHPGDLRCGRDRAVAGSTLHRVERHSSFVVPELLHECSVKAGVAEVQVARLLLRQIATSIWNECSKGIQLFEDVVHPRRSHILRKKR